MNKLSNKKAATSLRKDVDENSCGISLNSLRTWQPKVFIKTFGCQMNVRDSEIIAGMFLEKGCEVVEDAAGADVILFNTCSVRQHAEERVIGNIQKLKTLKKQKPELRIGVVGCMAQRHGEKLFEEFPHIDIVVGPNNIYDLPDLIIKSDGAKILAVDKVTRPKKKEISTYRTGVFSAFVNVMYGCNNFCSYCIVPYVRGREVSRPKNEIVDEVKGLADSGFKEVTLLGQNVNSYGKGLTNKITFPELLEEVSKINGIERVRFTTSHPKDADKSLFRAIKEVDKVCENLHLPLQSASDKILDLMNRKYKYEEYRWKIDLLRKMVPDVGITTDIVVGFPSEKERDFKATRKAIEEIGYNAAFIFKYSPRPPAEASNFVDDVPEEAKKERNNELLVLQKKISSEKNKALIGTLQEVLVEGKSRINNDELVGRTRNNTSCVFAGDESLAGRIVSVRVKDSSPFTLKGEIT